MEPIAESDKLLLIFPEEIWLLIGERIFKVEDHLHLRDSSQYFRTLFESLLDRAIFSEVAKILNRQFKRYPGQRSKVHPVMVKCRLVCRHWKESVDAVLQNISDTMHPRWFGPRCSLIFTQGPPDIIVIEEIGDITRFRQHFAETHAGTKRNPFARRFVSIQYGLGLEYIEHVLEQILIFLREYGQHIWHCNIIPVSLENWNFPLNIYRKLYEMLELMQNLQTLSLACRFFPSQHGTHSDDLKTFFTTHPFPILKHLKLLYIDNVPTLLSKSLMRANPQIKVLQDLCYGTNIETVSYQENLPHLEQLTTAINNKQQFITLKIMNANWPLNRLYLQILCDTTTKALFKFLGTRWSATLAQLSLDFRNNRKFLDVVPLQLPNLQVFSIKSLGFAPLDFLLPAKSSLNTLSVRVNTRCFLDSTARLQSALAAENTVRFLNFRNTLIESNIWSVFPKLRSVDFKDDANTNRWRAKPHVCHRLDWMVKQNENI